MHHIDEPAPRTHPKLWEPYKPPISSVRKLSRNFECPQRDFSEVLNSRRSRLGGHLLLEQLEELLWHSAGTKGYAESGRAGIPIEWRNYPSGGGLHSIQIVCIPPPPQNEVLLYDAFSHSFCLLQIDTSLIVKTNADEVTELLGDMRGWTFRFISDFDKVDAAYENALSIILRDAGCLLATICLSAEWLGLIACPLGFLGHHLCEPLGFPKKRFIGVGGVQITSRTSITANDIDVHEEEIGRTI